MDASDIFYLVCFTLSVVFGQLAFPDLGRHISINYYDALLGLQGLLFIGGFIESTTLRKMSKVGGNNKMLLNYVWTFLIGAASCLVSIACNKSYTATFILASIAALGLVFQLYMLQYDKTLNDAIDGLAETLKKVNRH